MELPRPMARGVGAAAGVVVSEAGLHVGFEPDVRTTRITPAQDVDDALGRHLSPLQARRRAAHAAIWPQVVE